MLTCLETLVGLSKKDCTCYATDRPTNYNESKSGLYVDSILPLEWVDGAEDCTKGGVWDILATAREDAALELISDIQRGIIGQFDEAYNGYSSNSLGLIGQERQNGTNANPLLIQGVRIYPKMIRGGIMLINGVGLALEYAPMPKTVTISVYASYDLSAPIDSVDVVLTQNKKFAYANFTTPIQIDLRDVQQSDYYYIVYEMPTGGLTINNLLESPSGTCCGALSREKANPWLQFLYDAVGIESLNVPTLGNGKTSSNANGLRLNIDFCCNFADIICNIANSTFNSTTAFFAGKSYSLFNELSLAMRARIAIAGAGIILKSGNINRYTLLSQEALFGAITSWKKYYAERIKFFCENFPYNQNDCLSCKTDRTISINTVTV